MAPIKRRKLYYNSRKKSSKNSNAGICKKCNEYKSSLAAHYHLKQSCFEFCVRKDSTVIGDIKNDESSRRLFQNTNLKSVNDTDFLDSHDIDFNQFVCSNEDNINYGHLSNDQNVEQSRSNLSKKPSNLNIYSDENNISSINNNHVSNTFTITNTNIIIECQSGSSDLIEQLSQNILSSGHSNSSSDSSISSSAIIDHTNHQSSQFNHHSSQKRTSSFNDNLTSFHHTATSTMYTENISQRHVQNKILCFYDFVQHQQIMKNTLFYKPIDHSYISSIMLLKMLKNSQVASSLYKEIIIWHELSLMLLCSSRNVSISTYSIIRNKKLIIKLLEKFWLGDHADEFTIKPLNPKILTLPSQNKVKMSRFCLKSMIFSLITDNVLMKPENLLHNDPLYRNPNDRQNINNNLFFSDIHHGLSFAEAHKKFCKEPFDLLVPIIPFIDATPIDTYARNKLEVVMFTLGIFNQSTRNKPDAWRVLGYVPDKYVDNSDLLNKEKKSMSRKDNIMNRMDYHHMLSYVIEDLVQIENSDGILVNLPSPDGSFNFTYRLKFTVLFIIGDAVGNDKLCDRYINYNKTLTTLCRDCDCPSEKLDDYNHICNFTKRSQILNMSDSELKQKSYYKIPNNALDKLSFGGNIYGLNGCLPPEPLHQLIN